MKIYYANINGLDDKEIFECQMRLIPEERRNKIIKCKQWKDRLRGLCAGLLLEYGLQESGLTLLSSAQEGKAKGQRTVQLEISAHGKPRLCGCQEIYFNLSHSGDFAAAVFADGESGIDIEVVRKWNIKIMERCFTKEEQKELQQCDKNKQKIYPPEIWNSSPVDLRFTELWTRKESFIKAEGSGLRLPLNHFSVLGDLSFEGRSFYFKTFLDIQGYALSVCTQSPISDVVPIEIYTEKL